MKNIAICIENKGFEVSLEKKKLYEIVPDDFLTKKNLIRIIDESNVDYIYPISYFIPLSIPVDVLQKLEFA